jgi:hypothetical protein
MAIDKVVADEGGNVVGVINYLNLHLKNTHINILLNLVIKFKNSPDEYELDENNLKILEELKLIFQRNLEKGLITRNKMKIPQSQDVVVPMMMRSEYVVFIYNLIRTALDEKIISEVHKASCLSEAGMHIAKTLDNLAAEKKPT